MRSDLAAHASNQMVLTPSTTVDLGLFNEISIAALESSAKVREEALLYGERSEQGGQPI